jgi:hypothetical protein
MARLNDSISDDKFFDTLEAAVLIDPSRLRITVEHAAEVRDIYEPGDYPEAHEETVCLYETYLEFENDHHKIWGIGPVLYRSV